MTESNNVVKGIVAGFVATIVLSALMITKSMMGLMPELNVIRMLASMMGANAQAAGWVAHILIGTVLWGTLFALVDPDLPGGSYWVKGVIFGVGAWLLMMVSIMPLGGAGLFGMNLGTIAPIMTLVLHIIFGAVLGGVYGLERPDSPVQLERPRSS
jgi:hypothetical protein